MDSGFAQMLLGNFNGRVLKEPRGFMKILQFLSTVCAFATTTSYLSYIKLSVDCGAKTETVPVPLSYSFKLYQLHFKVCDGNTSLVFRQDFSSDSEFFVAIGVLAFLYTLAALCLYTLFDKLYANDPRIPTIDFVTHCLLGILFLACSSAWANSLNGLKSATTIDAIVMENPVACATNACNITQEPNFSKLNISVILGFLNTFLFTSNLWFIYKETIFFAGRQGQDQKLPETQIGA